MKKYFTAFLILLLFSGCVEDEYKPPTDGIPGDYVGTLSYYSKIGFDYKAIPLFKNSNVTATIIKDGKVYHMLFDKENIPTVKFALCDYNEADIFQRFCIRDTPGFKTSNCASAANIFSLPHPKAASTQVSIRLFLESNDPDSVFSLTYNGMN